MHMIDGLPAIQHPAAVPIYPAWAAWYRVQTGAACPASGRVCRALRGLLWFWHGLRGCLRCAVCSGALGLGSPPLGYMGRAGGGGAVAPSRRKNSKKAFLLPTHPLFSAQNTHTPIANLKNFPQKQKDPYKGSGFCVILALQALKGRNL